MNESGANKAKIPLINEILREVLVEAARRNRSLNGMLWRIDDIVNGFLSDGDWKKFIREWAIYNTQAAFGVKQYFRTKCDWEKYIIDGEAYSEKVWKAFEKTREILSEYGIEAYLMTTTTSDGQDLTLVNVNIYDLICKSDSNPKKIAEIMGRFLAAQTEAMYDEDSRQRYEKMASQMLAFAKD